MDNNSNQTIFNEAEAINITIDHGYDGSEFNTSVWKKRGCLIPDRTLSALIDKLKTIYNHVEVTGKGKNRKYILTDKKEIVSERIFKYKGTVSTIEDEIMKEYIFNMLVSLKFKVDLSYRKWAIELKFPNIELFDVQEMIDIIKRTHSHFPVIYNPKEVVSIFIRTIDLRNKNVIEKTFHKLQNENRIEVIEKYNAKYTSGKYKEIEPKEATSYMLIINGL